MPDTITITHPDDWHLHVRDGAALEFVLPHSARRFNRAIIMPNLNPPVIDVAQAEAYRARILAALPAGVRFTPLMTLYLTGQTTATTIAAAHDSDFVYAVKLYPAGATTNSSAGVTCLDACHDALAAMETFALPLLVHGEVVDPDIDIFDREAVFIDRVLLPLLERYPRLKIVMEHITTRQAVEFVTAAPDCVAATITAHHLLYSRNALFRNGLQPHWYCLPVLKREEHRQALIAAATSGSPKFFLGTDSAPHSKTHKETACGCAGCYTGLHALELYAEAFDAADALDKFEGFASFYGPDFYGLPRNSGTLTLERIEQDIPAQLPYPKNDSLIPLRAGGKLAWTITASN